MSNSERPLIKGPPRPPRSNPLTLSYSQPARSRNEVSVCARGDSIKVVEFNGLATPQPFLDPSIMQKRAQLEREWKVNQEMVGREKPETSQAEASSTS
ncbi:c92fb853-3db9-454d-8703-68e1ef7e0024 [Sclerotinia trifoliorum]|uniref:C92fb853-3db9-454d-8703-68e1ef7e0024 n=1 Tax=Sclerotinia trifoliorum TaxID=28548 RepID=A0A8H2VNJ2_9HELO|nr:c92fb853-3db9-454d-8703-68e1ef7e0024 [Sclerotinia trifoliorum]